MDGYGAKLSAILNWALDEKPDFDTKFVESVQAQLESKGSISTRQMEAVDNIIDRFKIDVEAWNDE